MSDLEGGDSDIVTPIKRLRRHATAAQTSTTAAAPKPTPTPSNTTTSMSEDEQSAEPEAFSLQALGLQRVGTAMPPRRQPQQPLQMLNARGMPARIRKRNRLFYDDDIINDDKPLRMSLSPKKTPLKGTGTAHSPTSTPSSANTPSTSNRTPTRVLKKRKVIGPRYMMRSDEKQLRKRFDDDDDAASGTSERNGVRRDSSSGDLLQTTPKRPTQSNDTMLTSTPKSASRRRRGSSSHPSTPTNRSSNSSNERAILPQIIVADKKLGQRIGLRLRNLLKLPKAHKWVIYEWFYSFIDKALFDGENDFQVCLKESFPHLCTRQLNRAEWRRVRALLGKPRRCSPAFFEQERRELERKRQKIRFMQTRKCGDIKDLRFVRELPDKIPLPLPVGTKVTARLRVPQDGIFNGAVAAFDSRSSMYRVTFERNGLGTHSIPDFEIASENFHETLPLQTFTKDFRPNLMSVYNGSVVTTPSVRNSSYSRSPGMGIYMNKSDPLLGQFSESPFQNPVLGREHINGYPAKLLETLVRVKRALTFKQSKLQRLRDMNNEAETKGSQQQQVDVPGRNPSSDDSQSEHTAMMAEDFQRRYASIVISMEKMNRDIQDYLNEIQPFATELTRDPQVQAMLAPSYLREKCREAAEFAVQRNSSGALRNSGIIKLIKNMATVLLVASHLRNDENSAQVTKVLEGCIEEVKSGLHDVNIETFQKHVQIHLHHIRLGIGQSMLPAVTTGTALLNTSSGGGGQ